MNASIKVIQPIGVLDGTQTSQFQSEVSDIVNAGAKVVLVDLKEVTFMDSSGLAALVIAFKAVRSAGGKMCICSLNQQVKMLFELTSMDQVFEIFANQDECIQTVGSS